MNNLKLPLLLSLLMCSTVHVFAGSVSYRDGQPFTGTFTVPAGVTTLYVTAVGYGGNGGSPNWNGVMVHVGGDGGQGGGVENMPVTVVPGNQYTYTFRGDGGVSFAGLNIAGGTSGGDATASVHGSRGADGTPGPPNGNGSYSACILLDQSGDMDCSCTTPDPGGFGGGGDAAYSQGRLYSNPGCYGGPPQLDISWVDQPILPPTVNIRFSYFMNMMKSLFTETAFAFVKK